LAWRYAQPALAAILYTSADIDSAVLEVLANVVLYTLVPLETKGLGCPRNLLEVYRVMDAQQSAVGAARLLVGCTISGVWIAVQQEVLKTTITMLCSHELCLIGSNHHRTAQLCMACLVSSVHMPMLTHDCVLLLVQARAQYTFAFCVAVITTVSTGALAVIFMPNMGTALYTAVAAPLVSAVAFT
jgi:hypothetical protein